jgi:hypothetical protein
MHSTRRGFPHSETLVRPILEDEDDDEYENDRFGLP